MSKTPSFERVSHTERKPILPEGPVDPDEAGGAQNAPGPVEPDDSAGAQNHPE
jgi:hypothetical protein